MMFVITFGLSMDYEMFLLSSMQGEWTKTHDNSTAVANGLANTAKVITAAAAIMVCVFGSFVVNDPIRILDVLGLGLAVAILIDATIIRMVLVPVAWNCSATGPGGCPPSHSGACQAASPTGDKPIYQGAADFDLELMFSGGRGGA